MDNSERVDRLKHITHVLLKMGFHANQCGYRYLRSSIYCVIDDDELITSVTKLLYPEIGKRYGVTGIQVERAIRTSIETAWHKPNVEIMKRIFPDYEKYLERRPTNSDFIEAVVKYLIEENAYFEDI